MLSQHIHNRVYYFLLITLAFCIPLNRLFSAYIIGFIVLNWLLEARFVQKFKRIISSTHRIDMLLFGLLYLSYLAGLIYTQNIDYGLFSIQVKGSLIIFPILFATIDTSGWTKKHTVNVFVSFIAGCFIASLVCIGYAVSSYLDTGDKMDFYYISLSIFHHPSYSAMFTSFAIALLIWFLLDNDSRISKVKLIINLVLIIYFLVFAILLSSKAGILTLIIIFFLTVSYVIFINRKYFLGSFLIIAITLLFIATLNIFPYSSMRFNPSQEIIQNEREISNETTDGTVERVLIWKYSIELINEHFFFGVGTGDVISALKETYGEHDFTNAYENELNPHNQYLQTFISLGVIGFLLLIFSLLLPAIYSAWRKGFVYFLFLVIIAFNFLVESMLERQAGVVFYAFFNGFLFMMYLPPRNKMSNEQ